MSGVSRKPTKEYLYQRLHVPLDACGNYLTVGDDVESTPDYSEMPLRGRITRKLAENRVEITYSAPDPQTGWDGCISAAFLWKRVA